MTADTAPPFRFKILPILVVAILGFGLPWLAAESVDYARHFSHLVPAIADQRGWLFAQRSVQFVLALIAIGIAKLLVPADYGLHVPEDRSYAGWAVLWGLVFGILMTAIDHAPNLVAHAAPKLGYPLTAANVVGWLGLDGLYVGPTEEVLYRALLVTYLSAAMPGKVRLGVYAMNGAGIAVAAILALPYAGDFFGDPPWMAASRMACVFALGVLYAWWLEKSGSILAPVVGHGVLDLAKYALVVLMVLYW